ncbi:hypothetical protein ACDA63_04505 [Uliginosibacterium sp. sgz301328]|uniref:hypothetical protein n=1 Tax=Uliginosibacterium sp. sgz301328 TaxID=3243764 RepID=UPI00359DD07F
MKVDAVGSSFEEAWSDLYGAACDMALAPLADRMAGRVDAILEKFFALAANAPFIKQLLDTFTPKRQRTLPTSCGGM